MVGIDHVTYRFGRRILEGVHDGPAVAVVLKGFPARLAGRLCQLDYGRQSVEIFLASTGGKGIEINRQYQIGIEIQYRRQVALHCGFGEHKRLMFLIAELYLRVLEIDKGGCVRAVVDRACRLYL